MEMTSTSIQNILLICNRYAKPIMKCTNNNFIWLHLNKIWMIIHDPAQNDAHFHGQL